MQNWVIKRIKKELKTYNYSLKEETRTLELSYNNKIYYFLIPFNYPFKPPSLILNNKELIYNPSNFPKKLWNTYCQYNNCMCCNSIKCSNNWSPCMSLISILKEYIDFTDKLKSYHKYYLFSYKNRLPDVLLDIIFSYI